MKPGMWIFVLVCSLLAGSGGAGAEAEF